MIDPSDLKLYASQFMGTSDSCPVGGTCSTTLITVSTIGEFIKNFAAMSEGGTDKYQYGKAFVKNTHATDSFTSGVEYIFNGLKDVATSGTAQVRINDATDATGTTIRLIGHTAAGVPQIEDIAIGGSTSWVTGTKVWKNDASGIIAALCLDTNTGAEKVLATANVEIKRDIDLGIIPLGFSSAVGFFYIGLSGTLNDSATSNNRLTAPTGITFTKPNNTTDGIAFAGTLAAGDKQGIWGKAIYYDGMPNLADCDVVLKDYGNSA